MPDGRQAARATDRASGVDGRRIHERGKERWTVRDVVTLVAFNLIIIAITFVLKMVEDLLFSPQTEFFIGSWLFPLASTPFYLVLADRIGKHGGLAATTLVFGTLYSMWGGDSYRKPLRVAMGFFVYWVIFGLYGVIPYLLFQDAYVAQLSALYSTEDAMAMVAQYTELPWILLMMVQFAVGTAVGGLIGARLLKKHVRKAKIV